MPASLRSFPAWFYSATVWFGDEIHVFQAPVTDMNLHMDHNLPFETQQLQSREKLMLLHRNPQIPASVGKNRGRTLPSW